MKIKKFEYYRNKLGVIYCGKNEKDELRQIKTDKRNEKIV